MACWLWGQQSLHTCWHCNKDSRCLRMWPRVAHITNCADQLRLNIKGPFKMSSNRVCLCVGVCAVWLITPDAAFLMLFFFICSLSLCGMVMRKCGTVNQASRHAWGFLLLKETFWRDKRHLVLTHKQKQIQNPPTYTYTISNNECNFSHGQPANKASE